MRRLGLLIVFSLALTISVSARSKVFGWAEKGNQDVRTSPSTTYKTSASYPGCTVTVYLAGTTTIATIFANNSGTSKANPFTSDSNAFWFFYVDDGRYDVKFSGTGISTPFTIGDIIVFDNTVSYAGASTRGLVTLDTAPAISTTPIAVGSNSEKVRNVLKAFSPLNYGGVAGAGNSNTALVATITACQAAGGGIVVIPSGVWNTDDTLTIPSNVTIVGTGYTNGGAAPSVLRLTVGSKPLLKFISDFRYNAVRDLELRAATTSGSTGILLQGAAGGFSFGMEISNVAIDEFDIGIDINSTAGSWQIEQVKIDHCLITGTTTSVGFRINTINSSVHISNTHFLLGARATGLLLNEAGIMTVDNSNGGGPIVSPYCVAGAPSNGLGFAFVDVEGSHISLRISNCATEGVGYFLLNNASTANAPITLISNTIQGRVTSTQSTDITSIGNIYQAQNLVHLEASTQWISQGDTTNDVSNNNDCGVDQGGPSIYINDSGTAIPAFEVSRYQFPSFQRPVSLWEITGLNASASAPFFSIGSSVANKTFFRLGQSDGARTFSNYYDFKRDASGYLAILGSQALPSRGITTNGGIELYGTSSTACGAASRGMLNYNASSNLMQWCQNNDAVPRTFIGATTTITTNRVPYISNGTIPTIANSSLSYNGTDFSFLSGNVTVAGGNLSVAAGTISSSGNISSTAGNISTTSGTVNTASGNIYTTSGRIYASNTIAFTNADTTPSVLSGNNFTTNNSGATSITMFDDGTTNQIIYIQCTETNTTFVDGGNLKLAGNLVCTADDMLVLKFNGTNWYELSRSIN